MWQHAGYSIRRHRFVAVIGPTVLLIVSFVLFIESPSADGDQEKQRAAAPFSTGLLWRITAASSPEKQHGYLFGTIHAEDPRVTALSPPVQHAFDASVRFCMEMLPDFSTQMQLAQSMLYTDGQYLESVIGGELFQQTLPLMAERGVPKLALTRFKPWAVFATLNAPKAETGMFLDMVLYQAAQKQNKEACGLETVEEQIAVFEKTPIADQIALLRETVEQYSSVQQTFDALIERYLARDIAGLHTLSEEQTPTTPAAKEAYTTFLRRLVDERNIRMAERVMGELQKEESVFIAVGALHLPGEQGLLHLLQQRGYSISVVY
jgi:uncharacterized protein